MSHESLEHMMMPTQPGANLIVVHACFPFGLLQRSFDRPSQTADPYQFLNGTIAGCIAQIELHFCLRSQTATTDQPLSQAWQAVLDGSHTQDRKLGQQGSLAAFMDPVTLPSCSGQAQDQRTHFFRRRGCPSNTPMRTRPSHGTLTRFFDLGCAQPNSRV